MPGIILCWRRWGVSSDDFVYPAAGEIFVRIIWLIALATVLAIHQNSFQCGLLETYYIGMIIILVITILLDVVIMWVSSRGTIVKREPRRHMTKILYFKLLTFIPEVVWTALGTSWAFSYVSPNCSEDIVVLAKVATIIGWCLLFLLLVAILVVFDPVGGYHHRHATNEEDTDTAVHWLWKIRCKLLCCGCFCTGEDKSTAYEDVAKLLTTYFRGLDFVVTDVAAALILVQAHHRSHRHTNFRCEPIVAATAASLDTLAPVSLPRTVISRVVLTYPQPADWMTVPFACHYMKFALASYGWLFFVYDNRLTGPFRLCGKFKCCACVRRSSQTRGDNCCSCNTAAILEQTGIRRRDIIYSHFANNLYEVPFYIVMDHETRSVVISIRGTLSFDDALTDLSIEADDIGVDGLPEDSKAHRGILRAAHYIRTTLARERLLESAFCSVENYQLVVTGHSLGAGAAAILAILLRPEYPNLRCFAYSPPGWLLSLPLTRYADEFVCSVVVGNDIVPRMGLVTFDKLKTQMQRLVNDSQHPKYRILASGFWQTICDCCAPTVPTSIEHDEEADQERSLLYNVSEGSRGHVRRYTDESSVFSGASGTDDVCISVPSHAHPLYMPGQVLFLEEIAPASSCFESPSYRAVWARPEAFDEIIVGTTMVIDHLPNVVYRALRSLTTDTTLRRRSHPGWVEEC